MLWLANYAYLPSKYKKTKRHLELNAQETYERTSTPLTIFKFGFASVRPHSCF